MSIQSVMPSNLSSSLLLLLSIFLSISLFQGVGTLHKVAKVLELQRQSFQWIFRVDFLKDWLVWFPCCPKDSQESSPAPQFKSINSSAFSLLYGPTLTSVYDYWKNHSLDNMDLCQHTLSRFVIAFLPRSKRPLISWLQSRSRVLEPKKTSATVSIFSPSICHEVMGLDAMILVVWMLSLKPAFTLFSFTSIRRLFSVSSLPAIKVVSSAYWRLLFL